MIGQEVADSFFSAGEDEVTSILVRAGGGDDVVRITGSTPATLEGEEGNDSLYGGSGDDVLHGNSGHDGLFGGRGNDTIVGGEGTDRFLVRGTPESPADDLPIDRVSEDAILWFVNSPSAVWSDADIRDVDEGLRLVHLRTRNTKLLKRADQVALRFVREKVAAVPSWLASNLDGTITMYDSAWNQPANLDPLWTTIVHEIGHNWDEPEQNGWIPGFRALSGHVSNYAKESPQEDFCETLVATFFAGNDRYHPGDAWDKVTHVSHWLNSISS